jgi:hypothetical protein
MIAAPASTYVLLGDLRDTCCAAVAAAVRARGERAVVVPNPLAAPARFSWRLETRDSCSTFRWDGTEPIDEASIAAVLVRTAGWVEPADWAPNDAGYVQGETQAALLAWLWSLPCPVVNRCPAWLWYRPRPPFIFWQAALQAVGLPAVETLVTNDEVIARRFGGRRPIRYAPLTSGAHFIVRSGRDWQGLAAVQAYTPVPLTQLHRVARTVCVVGDELVWDRRPAAALSSLAPALREFGRTTGLAFVELVLADGQDGPRVVAVDPQPCLEHFGTGGRDRIVAGLVRLLRGGAAEVPR